MTFFRTNHKYVPVWCGFACLGWEKLTLIPSSVIPKKFLFGLTRTQYQKLSSGLMLVTFITNYIFQFGFADTEQYWHPSWLITLTFIRTGDKHIPLAPNCRVLKKKNLVWCGFTSTPSPGFPKKFVFGLKMTWDQNLPWPASTMSIYCRKAR